MPQFRIIHPITQTRRMRHLRKEQNMTDEQLDQVISQVDSINAQIDLITARIKVIAEILRVEDIVENANPDAG